MNECAWTRKICKDLRQLNALVFSIVGGRMQQPGWPDRYICHSSWCGFLEFKGAKTRVTKQQQIILRELNLRQPGCAWIVRYPNLLLGIQEFTFDGTAKDLLFRLQESKNLVGN